MRFLRTNTAIRITVGPFLDKTDGVTPEVALTVTSCKLTLVVDDGNVPTLVLDTAPTASGGANDMVHITGDDAGFYDLELAAANVNYLGRAMLAITDAATHCPVFHEFMILPANIYDSLVLGTDLVDVSVTQWLGTAAATPTVAGVPEVDVTHWLGTAAATPTTAGVPEVDVTYWRGTIVPAEHTAGYPVVTIKDGTGTGEINTNAGAIALVDLVTTLTTYTGNTVQSGDSFARIGAAGAGLTDLGGFSTTAKGQIQTEAEDAIVTHRLDELLNADSDIDGVAPPTVGSVFHELLSKTAGSFTFDQTTDSLEALRDNVGTAGAGLTAADDAVITAIAALNNLSSAQAQTAAESALQTYHLDHLIQSADPGSIVADSSLLAKLVSKSATPSFASFSNQTDSLEALRDRGDAAWITATGFSTHTAADVWTSGTRTLTAGTNIALAKGTGVTGFNDIAVTDIFTTAMTEAYRGTGATGTPAQLAYEILALLCEFTITSTTLTTKKLDGSTTAKTYTLNSATTPTGITEAT